MDEACVIRVTRAMTDTPNSSFSMANGMPGYSPPARRAIPVPKTKCWLCENIGTDHAKNFHAFVIQKAHTVGVSEMANQLREELLEQQLAGGAGDALSAQIPCADEVVDHIKRHVLHPNVQVSQILRNLLDMAETLREVVCTRDADGTPLIDVRTVSVYLKVVNEIMQIYRTSDLSKMLFADAEA